MNHLKEKHRLESMCYRFMEAAQTAETDGNMEGSKRFWAKAQFYYDRLTEHEAACNRKGG
jgi:hypothetical protein